MTIIDDIFFTVESTASLRIVAAILLTVTSITGTIFNIIVLFAIIFRVNKKDGFLKICCLKSFGNSIVCIGYLIWPVPVTFLNDYFLPHMFNAFMGQLVGWFAWCIGPFSQVLLTSNRIFAVFFPHVYSRNYRYAPSSFGILICLTLAFIVFIAFFPEGCHFLYNLQYIGWLPEESMCTSVRRVIFLVSMFIIVIFTTFCGILLFLKLIADSQSLAMTDSQSSTRRLQHQKNLLQTLVQNGLILVDTLNTTVTYQVFSLLFFQFITLAFSMVFIRTVEGFIMIAMNERINKGAKLLIGMKSAESSQSRIGHTMMVWNASTTSAYQK
ncbi:7TM GPCR serpentine receptor class x (Srx) domain-containing protein [Caenorhabditis elegans]|uniref:7TM GPCR serpentine receptor class x (Srx) domain-containing protein n=1 Tax=Caenorhabditis elegans TaxID=6239 RepID=N1NTG5_CAEEL|nr:7TM GPCR serpentine receptor class x (Srx) domain-containing protein [Caenorhabditis elegans]CCW45997.1 7TM GPCR serpentine receptor class x (Srx) domain-containing protein [Caenorhabditis elegans]|eukprot:NP_001294703.1 Serpentine Receptor, class X [Caenorhabditis elegans]